MGKLLKPDQFEVLGEHESQRVSGEKLLAMFGFQPNKCKVRVRSKHLVISQRGRNLIHVEGPGTWRLTNV